MSAADDRSPRTADQFVREIFPAELAEVRARRDAAGLRAPAGEAGPATGLGLVGIALSGGGIRSATFSLGVLQGLAQRQVLRAADYLSTVSGGGFTGGAVSALLNDPAVAPDGPAFPLRNETGRPDPPAVRHLRNSQHYLAPGGALDDLRMPALMARGILLNFLMIVPYVMLCASVTDLFYSALLRRPGAFFQWIPFVTAAAFGVVAITYPVVLRLVAARFSWVQRDAYERITSLSFLIALLALALSPLFGLVDGAVAMLPSDVITVLQQHLPVWLPRIAVVSTVVAMAAIVAGFFPTAKTVRNVIALWAVGIVGPAIPLTLYLLLCVMVIDPPGTSGRIALDLGRPATADEMAMLDRAGLPGVLSGVAPNATVQVITAGENWRLVTPTGKFVVTARPSLRLWYQDAETLGERLMIGVDWTFLAAAVAWLLVGAVFGNVNCSSAHGFYRDRLSRAYLIRRTNGAAEAVESCDDLKLSELRKAGSTAPYHLVNASLNLNGTTDLDVRGRNCDFFLFSKLFSGSMRLGYAPTRDVERVHPHLNLGTAVAISGAAAAPNAGVTTIAPLAFILTMLDVRLGYWLPNPGSVRRAGALRKLQLWLGTGPSYLLREAVQAVSSGGIFVNLSDGGHIENLAIYQLLRRRCRLIIAVDGEQDGDLYFDGLMRLLLFARIDLGVDIAIDLSKIRRGDAPWSGAHYAIGTITYAATPDGRRDQGILLYLKASMTGDEDEVMRDYHRSCPAFPHEPTANQFFNERQWEMYRQLGQHVVAGALDGAGDPGIADIQRLLATLRKDTDAHA